MEVYLESRVQNQPRNYTDALMDKIEATTDATSVFHSSQNTWVPFFIDVLLAAIETTSSTQEWSILFLSQFPEVQKRLQAEISEVIGNVKCPVGSDRDRMPYFQAVLEEVFRLAPPLPFGFHKCTEDTKLMGVDIKKNSLIVFNFFGNHIDPDKWEDPDIFKPERFLDGDQNFVKPELFTFGYGRRSCIGEHVARSQLFIFLTSILQSFNIYPEKKLDNLRGNLTIGYRCVECKVIFEPRDKVKSD
ncbi:unnamed protein product [Allacma fusca]|uniref:Cytochrome P450 n=1 Tax=Allacma fusca TaxID=39272 RepID=A0A8J2J164_9HEXA|nr:unnamed protein product [Allacma fusca]